jgi:hypothetical protein
VRAPLLLIAIFAAGCGASSPRPSNPSTNLAPAEPGIAPRPYTAEQIRDGMPVGTELRYRLEENGQPPTIMVMKVIAADEKTGTIATQILAEDGTLMKDAGEQTSEWSALVKHASFPLDATKMTESTIETPLGLFPSVDYAVRSKSEDGVPVLTTYRFARALPGPPVSLVREKDGQVVSRMTLIARK